jgi:hypothetical protein
MRRREFIAGLVGVAACRAGAATAMTVVGILALITRRNFNDPSDCVIGLACAGAPPMTPNAGTKT